jgi:hypothetical protein
MESIPFWRQRKGEQEGRNGAERNVSGVYLNQANIQIRPEASLEKALNVSGLTREIEACEASCTAFHARKDEAGFIFIKNFEIAAL